MKVTDLVQPGTNQLSFRVNHYLISDPGLQAKVEDLRVIEPRAGRRARGSARAHRHPRRKPP
ncbi:hypothetical protein BE20_41630 [Sorangium cellulosum]|nr:hypothetical protein BE20_41630 [Sorangium cellulosum]